MPLRCAASALAVVALLARANFGRVQLAFVAVGIGVALAYAFSAVLAHPDWVRAATYLVVPHGRWTSAYLLAVVGKVGTTITPWGQAFIQSYVADKGLGPHHLRATRVDTGLGALLTNLVAASSWWPARPPCGAHGQTNISSAADAAKALGPLLGQGAEVLFAAAVVATASALGWGASSSATPRHPCAGRQSRAALTPGHCGSRFESSISSTLRSCNMSM